MINELGVFECVYECVSVGPAGTVEGVRETPYAGPARSFDLRPRCYSECSTPIHESTYESSSTVKSLCV